MPNTLTAIRRYPTTTFLAVLLFLVTLAVATGSLGIVRPGGNGGGGSEDGGSGFGGTGRSGEFGGSGPGGTGMPSPFITLDDSREETAPASEPVQAPVDPIESEPALEIAVEMAVETTAEPVAESAPVREALAERIIPAVNIIDEDPMELNPVDGSPTPAEQNLLNPAVLPAPIQVVEAPVIEAAPVAPAETEPVEEMSAVQEAPQLVDNLPPIVESEADSTDRNILPERIQRPELPPFQRVRPIERPSIAAPPAMAPARPMRF